jgi:hypothetical protein
MWWLDLVALAPLQVGAALAPLLVGVTSRIMGVVLTLCTEPAPTSTI